MIGWMRWQLGWMHWQEKRHHLPFREQLLHPLWDEFKITSADGETTSLYVNQLTGTLSRSKFLAPLAEPGGCLADEMVSSFCVVRSDHSPICVSWRCFNQRVVFARGWERRS